MFTVQIRNLTEIFSIIHYFQITFPSSYCCWIVTKRLRHGSIPDWKSNESKVTTEIRFLKWDFTTTEKLCRNHAKSMQQLREKTRQQKCTATCSVIIENYNLTTARRYENSWWWNIKYELISFVFCYRCIVKTIKSNSGKHILDNFNWFARLISSMNNIWLRVFSWSLINRLNLQIYFQNELRPIRVEGIGSIHFPKQTSTPILFGSIFEQNSGTINSSKYSIA